MGQEVLYFLPHLYALTYDRLIPSCPEQRPHYSVKIAAMLAGCYGMKAKTLIRKTMQSGANGTATVKSAILADNE